MKHCPYCGSPLDEGFSFCGNCGKPISSDINKKTEENDIVSSFKKVFSILGRDKKFLSKILIVFNVIVVGVIGLIIYGDSMNTIKLVDYFQYKETTGLDGYGKIAYSFDYEKLILDVIGELEIDYDSDDLLSWGMAYEAEVAYNEKCDALTEGVSISFGEDFPNGSLSNGDVFTVTIDFDSGDTRFGKKIKGGTVKYEISGLEEGEKLDLFSEDFIKINVEGVNGSAVVNAVRTSSEYWFTRYVAYDCDKKTGLSNGDVITFSLNMDDYNYNACMSVIMENGYTFPKDATKQITVSGLKTYATESDITSESARLLPTLFDIIESNSIISLDFNENTSSVKSLNIIHYPLLYLHRHSRFRQHLNKLLFFHL